MKKICFCLGVLILVGCASVQEKSADFFSWEITVSEYVLKPIQNEFWHYFPNATAQQICFEQACGKIIEYRGAFADFVETLSLEVGFTPEDAKAQSENLADPILLSSNYVDWKNVTYMPESDAFYFENNDKTQTLIVTYDVARGFPEDMSYDQARTLLEYIKIVE